MFVEVELGADAMKNLANRQYPYNESLFVGFFMHFFLIYPYAAIEKIAQSQRVYREKEHAWQLFAINLQTGILRTLK